MNTDRNLEKILKNFDFYSFDTLSSHKNNSIVLTFNNYIDVATFSDIKYGGSEKDYIAQKEILKTIIKEYINSFDVEFLYLKKYSELWLINEEICKELVYYMKANDINNNSKAMIVLRQAEPPFELFLDSLFMYNSFFQILLPEERIIVSPTDHMDIFLDGDDISRVEKGLEKLEIEKYNVIKSYKN